MSGSEHEVTTREAERRARTLPLRVLEVVRAQRLWRPGERVLLAVSGGVDSVVMMHLMARAQGGHGGRLEVACVDHGLRAEALEEQRRVGEQAAALGLPFHAPRLALQRGPDLMARAREARRAALLALGADRIATAHQRDDQAETVLFALLRGSGSTGLSGMRALDPPWCRPLLREPREVIAGWARTQGLSWEEDPSNAGSLRGRARALIPLLDQLHGGAAAALARSGRLLAREDALLEALTGEAWARVAREGGLDLAGLRAEPEAIQLRLLRRLCLGCPGTPRADQLEAALGWEPEPGARLPLAGGWRLEARSGLIRALPPPPGGAHEPGDAG